MRLLDTLYARLALGLVLMLLVIGVLYSVLNVLATQRYVARLDQDLNRNLAQNLVADRNLVEQGKLNQAALKMTFEQYMVVNPSIEIYLLDLNGKLLAYSADPKAVKRTHVSLVPIRAFLSGDERYPLGDDPRSHDRSKAFSVTEVPSAESPEGYLYVVLRGEQYDEYAAVALRGFWARTGLWSMLISLALGLVAGLVLFYWLTKRLRRVTQRMEAFSSVELDGGPVRRPETRGGDEIEQIEQVFEQMATRIQEQLQALTDKDEQRRQLVAQVSHDLRTPLASMLGYVESLRLKGETLDTETRMKFLEVAHAQGLRLSEMIDSLFQLARLEAREVSPELEPFMPIELLFDVRQKYALRLEQAELGCDIQHDQVNAFALGDVSLFERVLDNLIDNAITHAEASSTIILAVHSVDNRVEISVSNRGRRLKPAELEVVFEPFFRIDSASTDRRHAGLGLAISRRIMENLGGAIRVHNLADGVCFTVSLPGVENALSA